MNPAIFIRASIAPNFELKFGKTGIMDGMKDSFYGSSQSATCPSIINRDKVYLPPEFRNMFRSVNQSLSSCSAREN